MSRQLPRSRDERGAAAVEYAGILLAALLVVSAVILAFGAFDIGAKVSCALSQVFGDGGACSAVSGDPGASGTPTRNMRPDADGNVVNDKTQTNTGKGEFGFNVGIAEAGGSFTDGGQMQFQRYEDGSGQYTITDSKSGSVKGSVGKDGIKAGDVEASLEAGIEGEVTVSDSEIRKCDTTSGAGSARSCSGFRDQYAEQIENHTHQGFSQIGGGDVTIDDPPDQYQHTIQGTLTLSAEGSASAEVGESGIDVGANGAAQAGVTRTTTYNSNGKGGQGEVDSTTTTYSYSLDGAADATVQVVENEISGIAVEGSAGIAMGRGMGEEFSYTEDKDGNLTTVTFTTTSYGQTGVKADVDVNDETMKGDGDDQYGDQYETTVTIDVTKLSDSDRQTVNGYVHSLNSMSPVLPTAALNPSRPVSADDKLGAVIHNNAIVTTSHYETETTSWEEEYDLWIASYTSAEEGKNRKLVDQHYLDLPGPDGSRTYRDTDAENKNGK